MAEPEVVIEEDDQIGDEDMEIEEAESPYGDGGPTGLEDIEPNTPDRPTFLEYDKPNPFHVTYRC